MMYQIRTKVNKVSLFDEQNHIGSLTSVNIALNYLRDRLHETFLMDTVYVDIDGRLDVLTQRQMKD